jgi:hypothetical protein
VAWDAREELRAGGVAAGVGGFNLAAHWFSGFRFRARTRFRGGDSEGLMGTFRGCERCVGVEGEGEGVFVPPRRKVQRKIECSRPTVNVGWTSS